MRSLSRLSVAVIGFCLFVPAAAPAQTFIVAPDFSGPSVDGSEPGLGRPMPEATAKELQAHVLWNMRAGLNVAALQCQFSPVLFTVKNYNQLIHDHAAELAQAQKTLVAYFSRVAGNAKKGTTAYDDYNTKTYNSFSTLYAQYGFCDTASKVGRDAVGSAKGELYKVAQQDLRSLRNSLVPAGDRLIAYNPQWVPVDPIGLPCRTARGKVIRSCMNAPDPAPEPMVAGAAPARVAAAAIAPADMSDPTSPPPPIRTARSR